MRKLQIKFPSQIRISGWDFGSSARAMNQAGEKVGLMTYESVSFTQADRAKYARLTFERKIMSTKTSIKRIALVAVSALGLGVLTSVAPASAAAGADGGGISAVASYAPIARVDSLATAIVRVTQTTDLDDNEITNLAAKFVAGGKPATSALTAASITMGLTADTSVYDAVAAETGTVSGAVYEFTKAGNAAAGDYGYVKLNFTPDVAGTYSILVWNDADGSGVYNSGEKSSTLTVTTAGSPKKITLTNVGGASIEDSTVGALIKVTLTDASGNPTVLAAGELIALTENGSGSFADYAANATTSLSDADFTRGGVAWFNVTDTAAETLTITAKGDGDLATTISATSSVVFKQKDIGAGGDLSKAADIAFYGTDGTDGWTGTSISLAAQTVTFKATLAAGDQDADAAQYTSVIVNDLKGQVQGTSPEAISNGGATASGAYTLAYELAVTVAKGKAYGTFTVPFAAVAAASADAVTLDSATDVTGIDRDSAVPSAVDLATSAFTSVNGGSYSVDATLLDQFGNGLASYPLSAVSTGRNSGAAAINKVTDADGAATFTFTDKGIVSTATSDAIDFYSGGDLDGDTDLTVSYVAVLAGTLTVDADATTLNAIDTDSAKAATVTLTFTALDSNSAPIVGLPITVAGVGTGASVSTGSTTVYTGADGTAEASVYASKTGVQSWTGTASLISKSATATRTFVNAATDAKVVALAAADGSVKATVTDNYGNPVKGVTVDFSRSGGVTFGGYASISVKTDASGIAEALVQGSGSVTASLAEADYAKSAWIAGYLGKTSSATASTTAVAGVGSASAEVTGSSQTSDAIDAANEATDAANAATDAANAAAEAADAATAAAQDAQAAVAALATQVASLIAGIKAQITTLTNLVIKIQKKVKA